MEAGSAAAQGATHEPKVVANAGGPVQVQFSAGAVAAGDKFELLRRKFVLVGEGALTEAHARGENEPLKIVPAKGAEKAMLLEAGEYCLDVKGVRCNERIQFPVRSTADSDSADADDVVILPSYDVLVERYPQQLAALKAKDEEIARLKAELRERDANVAQLCADRQEKERALLEANEKARLYEGLEETNRTLTQSIRALEESKKTLEVDLAQCQNRKDTLQNEWREQYNRCTDLTIRLSAAEAKVQSQEAEIRRNRESIRSFTSRNEALNGQLDQRSERIAELEAALERALAENHSLQAYKTRTAAAAAELEASQMSQESQRMAAKADEAAQLRQRIDELNAIVVSLQNERDSMMRKMEHERSADRGLKQRLNEAQQAAAEFRSAAEQERQQRENTQVAMDSSLQQSTARAKSLERQLAMETAKCVQLSKELEDVRRRAAVLEESSSNFSHDLSQAKTEIARLQIQLNLEQADHKATSVRLRDAEDRTATLTRLSQAGSAERSQVRRIDSSSTASSEPQWLPLGLPMPLPGEMHPVDRSARAAQVQHGPSPCEVCSMSFPPETTDEAIAQHFYEHSLNVAPARVQTRQACACSECGQLFESDEAYARHVADMHP